MASGPDCIQMASLSILCKACNNALYSERDLLDESQTIFEYQSHHSTLVSFLSAISQNCFVCCTVYDNVNHRAGSLLAEAYISGASTKYRMRNKGAHLGLQLVVLFLGEESHLETKFQLLSSTKQANSRFFPSPQLDKDTASPTTLNLVCHWYKSCCSGHPLCSRPTEDRPNRLPTRLLSIGDYGQEYWRLIEPAKDLIEPAKDLISPVSYITLSYRWGSEESIKLLNSTLDRFRLGQQLISDLPRTYRDAVTVARKLGITHLWIDALCIVQDVADDKEREIPQMRSVYSHAACNLAASASDGPDGGLFRTREPAAVTPGLVAAPSGVIHDKEPYHIVDMTYLTRHVFSGPLHKRGWLFQERLLSRRVLYFSQSQVFWECLTDVCCEAFPNGIPHCSSTKSLKPLWAMKDAQKYRSQKVGKCDTTKAGNNRTGNKTTTMSTTALRLWNSLLREYTECSLRFAGDRLAAFSGIADLFQDATGDEYVAGLWRAHLLHLLDWSVNKPRNRASRDKIAPSWSWASIDGPICPRFAVAYSSFLVSVSGLDNNPDNPSGHAHSLSLRLVGRLASSAGCQRPTCCELRPDALDITLDSSVPFYFLPLQMIHHDAFLPFPQQQVGASYSTEVSCLLLEPILCTLPVFYRRVGHTTVTDINDMLKLGLHVEESGLAIMQNTEGYLEINIV